MSEAEIEELHRLEAAATPAPWVCPGAGYSVWSAIGDAEVVSIGDGDAGFHKEEDAAWLVAARSAIPRLLAEREVLAAALETLLRDGGWDEKTETAARAALALAES